LARRLQRNQAGAAQPGNHPERNNNPHPLDRALQPARRKPAVVMLPPSVPWFAAAQRHLGCPDYARGYRRQLAVMRVRYATAGLARAGAFAPALRYRVIDTPPKCIPRPSALRLRSAGFPSDAATASPRRRPAIKPLARLRFAGGYRRARFKHHRFRKLGQTACYGVRPSNITPHSVLPLSRQFALSRH
jgi:hypothetical protein